MPDKPHFHQRFSKARFQGKSAGAKVSIWDQNPLLITLAVPVPRKGTEIHELQLILTKYLFIYCVYKNSP